MVGTLRHRLQLTPSIKLNATPTVDPQPSRAYDRPPKILASGRPAMCLARLPQLRHHLSLPHLHEPRLRPSVGKLSSEETTETGLRPSDGAVVGIAV
jgi:hypothetical protein